MNNEARARAARDAIKQYNLSGLIENAPIYRLTWPAALPGVCCISGQWDYTENGIETWYTSDQLAATLEVMQAIDRGTG